MLLLALTIALIFIDKTWLRVTTGIVWTIGLVLNAPVWPAYLVATAFIALIAAVIRLIVKKARGD